MEIALGLVMIALGILFFLYIPGNALNLATNVIFLGAGVLIIRRGLTTYGQARTLRQVEKKKDKSRRKQAGGKRGTHANA